MQQLSQNWIGKSDPDLDDLIFRVVSSHKVIKTSHTRSVKLSQKEFKYLIQEFKNAERSQPVAENFMKMIAEKIGVKNLEKSLLIAEMKEWDRAVEKSRQENRDLHDLGRGTIYVDNAEQVKSLIRLLQSCDDSGHLNFKGPKCQKVQIIDSKFDNYLHKPRSSGYAGSINFDLKIDLGQNRYGKFEVQIRPLQFKLTDKLSHQLFELIRSTEEIDKSALKNQHKELLCYLKKANAALFDEIAARHGYDVLRAKKPDPLDLNQLLKANAILDRVWTALDEIGGRNYQWKQDAKDAITASKTSLLNMLQKELNANSQLKPLQ